MVRYDTAVYGTIWHDTMWYGMSWYATVRCGMVWLICLDSTFYLSGAPFFVFPCALCFVFGHFFCCFLLFVFFFLSCGFCALLYTWYKLCLRPNLAVAIPPKIEIIQCNIIQQYVWCAGSDRSRSVPAEQEQPDQPWWCWSRRQSAAEGRVPDVPRVSGPNRE